MSSRCFNLAVQFLKLFILSLFFSPFLQNAMALDELFSLYNSPQGLAMGNAFTADAMGHASLYYNPAGLAKASRREWEVTPIALDGVMDLAAISRTHGAGSLGINRLMDAAKDNPGDYAYFRFNAMPTATRRGMGFALLTSYEYAARSDGTLIDINAGLDIIPTVGVATNLAGNVIKVGIAAKAILRNRIQGVYAHSQMDYNPAGVAAAMKEGVGFGADSGITFTMPNKWLPTLAVAWRDMLDTNFTGTNVLNSSASGAPPRIKQSFHAAVSVHPYFRNGWKGTVAVEFKHLERHDLPWQKRLHVGVELARMKRMFFWAGLNQMHWTLGLGMRVRGGNFELGTYGADVGAGATREEDRRVFFRYTIGF